MTRTGQSLCSANSYFERQRNDLETKPSTRDERSLIVPVYGNMEGLTGLLRQIERLDQNTFDSLIIVDDASPDEEIATICRAFCASNSRARFLRQPENAGFGATVNRGAMECEGNLLILNTDIDLTPLAVDRLFHHLERNKRAATVTPMTNNGFLVAIEDQTRGLPLEDISSATDLDCFLSETYPGNFVEIPSGVGFCMAIRKEVYDALNGFEEHRRGYGEDTAFCLRAVGAGWVNLLAVDTFVGHEGGGSFGAARRKMIKSASREIVERFPYFPNLIRDYLDGNYAAPVAKMLGKMARNR